MLESINVNRKITIGTTLQNNKNIELIVLLQKEFEVKQNTVMYCNSLRLGVSVQREGWSQLMIMNNAWVE